VNKLELVTRVRSLLRVALLQRRLRKTIAELRRIDPSSSGAL